MKKSLIFLVILFLTNLPSIYYSWYLKIYGFDTIQHFLGGFFVAMFMTAYLAEHLRQKYYYKNIIIITGATVLVGVLWEFSEYTANQTLINPIYRWFGIKAYFMGDLRDTVKDLLMDNIGALAFCAFHFLRSGNAHKT